MTELSVAAEMASGPFERTMPTVKVIPCKDAQLHCVTGCAKTVLIHELLE